MQYNIQEEVPGYMKLKLFLLLIVYIYNIYTFPLAAERNLSHNAIAPEKPKATRLTKANIIASTTTDPAYDNPPYPLYDVPQDVIYDDPKGQSSIQNLFYVTPIFPDQSAEHPYANMPSNTDLTPSSLVPPNDQQAVYKNIQGRGQRAGARQHHAVQCQLPAAVVNKLKIEAGQ